LTTSPLSADRPSLVLADLLPGARIRDAILVGIYAIAIVASAQLAFPVPGSPVPVTGQTFVVLLGAAALGTTRAALGGALFLGLGLAGVPWFAVTGGATVGYLVGFVAAAAIVGWCARQGWVATWRGAAAAMVLGEVAILALGTVGLMLVLGMSLPAAFAAGVVPFLIGDAAKIAAATALLPVTQRVLER
jgi:biotin transport system substrate-specific component